MSSAWRPSKEEFDELRRQWRTLVQARLDDFKARAVLLRLFPPFREELEQAARHLATLDHAFQTQEDMGLFKFEEQHIESFKQRWFVTFVRRGAGYFIESTKLGLLYYPRVPKWDFHPEARPVERLRPDVFHDSESNIEDDCDIPEETGFVVLRVNLDASMDDINNEIEKLKKARASQLDEHLNSARDFHDEYPEFSEQVQQRREASSGGKTAVQNLRVRTASKGSVLEDAPLPVPFRLPKLVERDFEIFASYLEGVSYPKIYDLHYDEAKAHPLPLDRGKSTVAQRIATLRSFIDPRSVAEQWRPAKPKQR